MKRIGIICVGNDCPGLNAAIRAAVVKGTEMNIEILGIRDGFKGFLEDRLDILLRQNVSGILHRGGTILGTSLFLPESSDINKIREKAQQYGITSFLILGGRLGMKAALLLQKEEIPSVLVPATIDNDLTFSDFSIGFFTAVEHVKEALDILHSTAESHHRVMIVETMGKPGGWIGTIGGLAGGADFIITHAEHISVDDLIVRIRSRYEGKKRFSIVVLENGAKLAAEVYHEVNLPETSSPAEVLGKFIEERLKEFKIEWRYTNLGYLQRGGSPVSMDRIIATQMSTRAVEMIKNARVYHAVGMAGLTVSEVPYSETLVNVRVVEEHFRKLAKLFY